MRSRLAALAALAVLTACTPDVERLAVWVAEHEAAATDAGLPCPEYADELAWLGLPEHFHYVIGRESHCQPGAVNSSSGALGLTQIMPSWLGALCRADIACTRTDLLEATANLRAAAYVYAVQGAGAWSQTW